MRLRTLPVHYILFVVFVFASHIVGDASADWVSLVKRDAPVVWYQFDSQGGQLDENAGSLGRAANAKLIGVTQGVAGLINGAVELDGEKDCINVPAIWGSRFTLEVVARTVNASASPSNGGYASAMIGEGVGFVFGPALLEEGETGAIQGNVHNGSGFVPGGLVKISPADEFHHMVLVVEVGQADVDGEPGKEDLVTQRTYVDGKLAMSATNIGTFVGSGPEGAMITVGHHAGKFANVIIDEWVLYDYALQPNQIESHAEALSLVEAAEPQ